MIAQWRNAMANHVIVEDSPPATAFDKPPRRAEPHQHPPAQRVIRLRSGNFDGIQTPRVVHRQSLVYGVEAKRLVVKNSDV